MTEGIDYVLVENAQTINYANIMDRIKCVFIGTKNYFFAIPYSITNYANDYREDMIGKADIKHDGMPLQEYILNELKNSKMSIQEFEDYIIKQGFDSLKIVNLNTGCQQIKAKASFLSTGLMYNETTERKGWKLFLTNYKHSKHAVKEFYRNHSKTVD
ncbi:MAG: hypothetical protein GQ574_21440 [Crocinitomix sp.]|nr:hypothetical protein [Crocinitomix sp.]